MATYKVIQDVEAEDKLIGPLTLRQFIYAGICAICGYLSFLAITKNVEYMVFVFIPMALVAAFFAWPWSRDQPTEIWALAKIRFLIKPRMRVWNQSGVKELVTITVPKIIESNYGNGLSQTEVYSRLKALANTIDSRGWAIKNVNVNLYNQPAIVMGEPQSDRLINISNLPLEVPNTDVQAADDMLDEQNNPVAQNFESMIAASTKTRREQLMSRMQPQNKKGSAADPKDKSGPQATKNNYWFLDQPNRTMTSTPQDTVTFNAQVVAPINSADDTAEDSSDTQSQAKMPDKNGRFRNIQPPSTKIRGEKKEPGSEVNPPVPKMTQGSDTAILQLASNDDLNVATIAREAHKRKEPPQDEVVISLR